MTQHDVVLWLGLVCVALAMISFRWGTLVGASSLALAASLLVSQLA